MTQGFDGPLAPRPEVVVPNPVFTLFQNEANALNITTSNDLYNSTATVNSVFEPLVLPDFQPYEGRVVHFPYVRDPDYFITLPHELPTRTTMGINDGEDTSLPSQRSLIWDTANPTFFDDRPDLIRSGPALQQEVSHAVALRKLGEYVLRLWRRLNSHPPQPKFPFVPHFLHKYVQKIISPNTAYHVLNGMANRLAPRRRRLYHSGFRMNVRVYKRLKAQFIEQYNLFMEVYGYPPFQLPRDLQDLLNREHLLDHVLW